MESNKETIKRMISGYINSVYDEIPPTEEEFDKACLLIRTSNSFLPITDNEFVELKKELKFTTVMTLSTGIKWESTDNGHEPWLLGRMAREDFSAFYWDRYKKYLEDKKHWNPRATSKLGQVADEILDLCGDPEGNPFKIRGLVMGDVQSGKTANYTALANKAADAGYRLIVVLAGIPEVLRQQTQGRLDAELAGIRSNKYLDPKAPRKNVPVGVGKYGTKKKIALFTSVANDFDSGVLKSNHLALDVVKCPVVLVVKKNGTILKNLYQWLVDNNDLDENGQIDMPFLLLDDEADNASVNTNNPDTNPTTINDNIRKLVGLFTKSTYLAVTATPFANIYIDSHSDEDLFPADFIYALSAPSGYIGAERLFGNDGDCKGMIETINRKEFISLFPDKHKKDYFVSELPSDLYVALNYFLLTNAIRDCVENPISHRSMMIHISRFVKVQNQIQEIVNAWLDQVKSDIRNYSKLSLQKSEKIASIAELHRVWDEYDLTRKSGILWKEILQERLLKAIMPIQVRAANGKNSSTALDYDNHKTDGLRVIAVGGNTLSRGITLEGLCVSYFYRTTNMYDTLMQMGRWFGYRPNYEDYVKIWLTSEEVDEYGAINNAIVDFRVQIQDMRDAKLQPKNFGLKIKQNPILIESNYKQLLVTARSKMKTGEVIKCPVSVSGHLLETPRLHCNKTILDENANLIKKFIDRLSTDGDRVSSEEYKTHGHFYWENVSGNLVAQLVGNFTTHPWHFSFNGKALSNYISDNMNANNWDVVLFNRGEGNRYPENIKCGDELLNVINTEKRVVSIKNTIKGDIIQIMGTKLKVAPGGSAKIGLSREEAIAIGAKYKAQTRKEAPDREYLVQGRKPILMIHIIEATYEEDDKVNYPWLPAYFFAIGIGFPNDVKGNKEAIYVVNQVELENWIDPEIGDDEE